MSTYNILLLEDIVIVGEIIAERFRKDGHGPEAAMAILAETNLYTLKVEQVLPDADRQWLLPEVRQAVVAEAVDFLRQISVENPLYARSLADTEDRRDNAAVAAERKRADAVGLAKENVLAVIDKSKSGRAGVATMNQRKKKTAVDHPAALAELVAEGVLEVVEAFDGRVSYRRK